MAKPGKAQPAQPRSVPGPPNWLSRSRLAWGGVHLVAVAALYFLTWATSTVPRTLAVAGGLALVIWWPL